MMEKQVIKQKQKNIEYLTSINENLIIFLLAYLHVLHLIFLPMVYICM